MLISNRILVLSNTIKRRLIHRASTFDSVKEVQKPLIKNLNSFDGAKLNFSNTSIQPFVNTDKINLLKGFFQTQSEQTCTYNFVIDEDVANVSHILIFDQSEVWNVSLAQIQAKHPDRITRRTGNMHKNVDLILLGSLDYAKQHDQPVTIVGISTSLYFLRGLVINFIKYNLWKNNFEVFLVISSHMWNNVQKTGGEKIFKFFIHCLFNFLFTTEEIAKYPRAAFLPPSKSDREDMILIKVSVNTNFRERIDEDELRDYFFFARIIGSKRCNYVIPTLEKWLPNCGPYLISKGISMTTQVSDLSHEEVFLLYTFVKQCEGYAEFRACTTHIFSQSV